MSWIIQQAKAETEDPLAYGRAIQAVIIKADRLGLNDIAQNAIDTLETIAPRIKTKKYDTPVYYTMQAETICREYRQQHQSSGPT